MNEDIVTNSTCLIGLERIGRLYILRDCFRTVYAPTEVAAECGGCPGWVNVEAVANAPLQAALRIQVDEGEAAAIALAVERGTRVLLDDKKARRLAQQMALDVIGTVGLLLRAKRLALIAEVRPLMDALQAVDFRIAPALYAEALRLAGET